MNLMLIFGLLFLALLNPQHHCSVTSIFGCVLDSVSIADMLLDMINLLLLDMINLLLLGRSS
jgi:hypothetical protein